MRMRCQVCGGFYEGAQCPNPHPAAHFCTTCGKYYTEESCPHDHVFLTAKTMMNLGLAIGSIATCDVTDRWSDVPPLPGIIVALDDDGLCRVIVALPGEHGSVAAITLPPENLS